MTSSNRMKYGLLIAPSIIKPPFNGGRADTSDSRPFGNGVSFAPCGYESIISSVVALLKRSSPSAIFGSVIPIIVSSIDRMFGARFLPHVSKKGRKVILPSFTNCNSPSSIVKIILMRLGKASAFNASPNSVLRSVTSTMLKALFFVGITDKASARFNVTASKKCPHGRCSTTALANAEPQNLSVEASIHPQNRKSAEFSALYINCFHRVEYTICR